MGQLFAAQLEGDPMGGGDRELGRVLLPCQQFRLGGVGPALLSGGLAGPVHDFAQFLPALALGRRDPLVLVGRIGDLDHFQGLGVAHGASST
jgi:hypothetical protein